MNVGDPENTSESVPVSSLNCPEIPDESVVAVKAEVPLPMSRPVSVVAPVPPFATVSVPTVSASAMLSDEVAT